MIPPPTRRPRVPRSSSTKGVEANFVVTPEEVRVSAGAVPGREGTTPPAPKGLGFWKGLEEPAARFAGEVIAV